MRSLICDTETTGKWKYNLDPLHAEQPDIVQLAFRLVEGNRAITTFSSYVKFDGEMTAEAAKVHGITEEDVRLYGRSPRTVLTLFTLVAETADEIVAHSAEFDRSMILRGCARAWVSKDKLEKMPFRCTMKSATKLLNISGAYGKPKWPTLKEAYIRLVHPDGFEGAHDALADVDACWKVLLALREKEVEILDYKARV